MSDRGGSSGGASGGGGVGGGGGGGRDRRRGPGGGGGLKGKRNRHKDDVEGSANGGKNVKPTVILAKPDRNAEFPTLQQSMQSKTEDEPQQSKTEKVVIASKAPEQEQQQAQQPAQQPQSQSHDPPKQERPCRLLDDPQSGLAVDSFTGFLSGDNADFIVVGALGAQGAGKSTLLNAIAGDSVFRVQSLERQMAAESCSPVSWSGAAAWVTPASEGPRIILLDCQSAGAPGSASALARALSGGSSDKSKQLFSPSEAAMETHALQMAGFLLSVCHVVIFAQDLLVDSASAKFLLAAEMLRPSSPAYVDENNVSSVTEYFPDLVIVGNRAELEDLSGGRLTAAAEFYGLAFRQSQLRVRGGLGINLKMPHLKSLNPDFADINLAVVPDFEPETKHKQGWFGPSTTFQEATSKLRKAVLSVNRRPLTTKSRQTERMWLQFAQKTWDSIKSSNFYMEYNRLL